MSVELLAAKEILLPYELQLQRGFSRRKAQVLGLGSQKKQNNKPELCSCMLASPPFPAHVGLWAAGDAARIAHHQRWWTLVGWVPAEGSRDPTQQLCQTLTGAGGSKCGKQMCERRKSGLQKMREGSAEPEQHLPC